MSEYQWYVKKAWIGVMKRVKDERGLYKEDVLLGVIRRSGTVKQLGHFCFIDVQVCGKQYAASGAEDRIYPFHSIKLSEEDKVPELELIAVGWCQDHNTYAFMTPQGDVVELIKAGREPGNVRPIPRENWPAGAAEKVTTWKTKAGVQVKTSSSFSSTTTSTAKT